MAVQDRYSIEHKKMSKMHSMGLTKSLRYIDDLLDKVQIYFENLHGIWLKGNKRKSFNILLLDPRITDNIPAKANIMDPYQSGFLEKFINGIFFIGKGTRPNIHSYLIKALRLWKKNTRISDNPTIQRILDIWAENYGIICVIVFQNRLLEECAIQETVLIDFIGLSNLTNEEVPRNENVIAVWSELNHHMLGLGLLCKAFVIYVNNGERQRRPENMRLKI